MIRVREVLEEFRRKNRGQPTIPEYPRIGEVDEEASCNMQTNSISNVQKRSD